MAINQLTKIMRDSGLLGEFRGNAERKTYGNPYPTIKTTNEDRRRRKSLIHSAMARFVPTGSFSKLVKG